MSSAAIAKVVTVDGWELRVGDDEEPRVLDIVLAERLGFARPAKIRDLVKKLIREGKLNEAHCFPVTGIRRSGAVQRSLTEFWLSEAGALKVIAKSETKRADAILDEVIDVFIRARRGLVVDRDIKPANVVLPTESATTTRTGDVPNVKSAISLLCKMASRSTNRPLQAIHGYVRKTFRTVGIHQLPIGLWPACEKMLNALALGTLLLPPRARTPLRLVASNNPKQPNLPGIEAS